MPKWTLPAKQDLAAQLEYIRKENPQVVSAIAAHIRTATEALDDFPHLGREGSVEGTRELVLARLPFICVYRLRGGRVEVLRLVHARMQWPEQE